MRDEKVRLGCILVKRLKKKPFSTVSADTCTLPLKSENDDITTFFEASILPIRWTKSQL
jgi:hypothetical protein